MKYEYKKNEKDIYTTKQTPQLINLDSQKFICIEGSGNPNSEEFGKKIEALYTIAYTIKMFPRNNYEIKGYFDYTVYPLEGFWDLSEKGRQLESLDKDELVYKIMIKQPDFITEEVFNDAKEKAKTKKSNEFLSEVTFEEITEGLTVQMLHVGPFSNEKETFDIMKKYIKDNNYEIKTLVHKEIYLSDQRKTSEEKLKTILRYRIK